jgi:hypothetical protein
MSAQISTTTGSRKCSPDRIVGCASGSSMSGLSGSSSSSVGHPGGHPQQAEIGRQHADAATM